MPEPASLASRLHTGLTGTFSVVVADEHTAPFVGSGKVRVLVNVERFDQRVQKKLAGG